MKISYKDILKLIISLALTVWVVMATSKEIKWSEVMEGVSEFHIGWILLSVGLSILSHITRAYRWTLLLETRNYKPRVSTTYLALMVGYLTNMAVPRLGEVARCTMLQQEEEIPVSFSLGTVITDRLMDLFMLGLLTVFLLLMEFDRLQSFFVNFIDEKVPIVQDLWPYLLAAAIAGAFALFYLLKKAQSEDKQGTLLYKVGAFVKDMLAGLLALRHVKKQGAFWGSTLVIWMLYFLMLYVISFGYAATDDLSLMAGVAVLVMGSLGMAAPVNNGIGVYQALVASILVLYGISHNDGYIFAVVSHGSQVIAVIVVGFISLMILNFRKRRKNGVKQQSENSQSATA